MTPTDGDSRADRPARADSGEALAAGDFGAWLTKFRSALRSRADAVVPCAGCTACCRSSQFVHIEADEAETLARIPVALQFPAPGRPRGHVVLGYDEHGHCPMLVDDRCSIYDARPRACRTFDCRVLAAANVDDLEHPLVAAQAARWRFGVSTPSDAVTLDEHRMVAAYLYEHRADLGEGAVPRAAAPLAALAIALLDHLRSHSLGTGGAPDTWSDLGAVAHALRQLAAQAAANKPPNDTTWGTTA